MLICKIQIPNSQCSRCETMYNNSQRIRKLSHVLIPQNSPWTFTALVIRCVKREFYLLLSAQPNLMHRTQTLQDQTQTKLGLGNLFISPVWHSLESASLTCTYTHSITVSWKTEYNIPQHLYTCKAHGMYRNWLAANGTIVQKPAICTIVLDGVDWFLSRISLHSTDSPLNIEQC